MFNKGLKNVCARVCLSFDVVCVDVLHAKHVVTWSFATVFGQRVTWRFPSLGEMFYLKSDEEHNILKRIYNSFLYMHMDCQCIDPES